MPTTLRLPDGSYMRHSDLRWLIESVAAMRCIELLGISNIGKSALLRLASQPDVWVQELGEASRDYVPVYIDCNSMLEMTDQGFYELVLRSLQESSAELAGLPELQRAYEMLINPASEFQVPLSFNRGLSAVLESSQRRVVLFFDEFDEPFSQIESRVFLNLRATRDRYRHTLAYVTATYHPLATMRGSDHCSEFCELFNPRSWQLAPLVYSDVERFIHQYAELRGCVLHAEDVEFIYQWTGGHPVMQEEVCRLWVTAMLGGAEVSFPAAVDPTLESVDSNHAERRTLQRAVQAQMRDSYTLRNECVKIWESLGPVEQAALLALLAAQAEPDPHALQQLQRRHILRRVEGVPRLFCRLLADYVQSRLDSRRTAAPTLWVDVNKGMVLVNQQPVELLTNLEYKLMLLLFQNAEKIVDKYEIVTSVWGEAYIDEVDDTRIEKLVSRLRLKVEPNPTTPSFITTVRGRGYQLILEPT